MTPAFSDTTCGYTCSPAIYEVLGNRLAQGIFQDILRETILPTAPHPLQPNLGLTCGHVLLLYFLQLAKHLQAI